MGQMTIDDRLIAEAKALAELLGTSVTEAMGRAVRERLARERIARDDAKRQKYEAIMAIARETSTLFPPGTNSDHSDLYDENGLPR